MPRLPAALLLISTLLLPMESLAADPDPVNELWQTHRSLPSSAISWHDAHHVQTLELMREAEALQARFEAGLVSLNAQQHQQLQWLKDSLIDRLAMVPTPLPEGGTAVISGTVREAGSLTPIGTGLVRANGFGDFSSQFFAAIQPDGSYSIEVPPGSYVLQIASTPEHLRQAWPDIPCSFTKYCHPTYGGEVLTVTAGATLTGRDFTLPRGVRVEGNVVGPGGTPIGGAFPRFIGRNRLIFGGNTTDANGDFQTFTALPPGEYTVFAEPPPGSNLLGRLDDGQVCSAADCQFVPTTTVTLSDTISPEQFDFVLTAGFGLSGTVFEADGLTPLTGARVDLFSSDGYTATSVQTDGSGNYTFPPQRPGDFVLIASHPNRLGSVHPGIDCFGSACTPEVGTPVSLGAAPQVIDFQLQPGSSVSGTIRRASDGQPVEGVNVSVANSLIGGRFATTDAAGNFTVEGLIGGTFFVQAAANPSLHGNLLTAHLGDITCPINFCTDHGQPLSVPAIGGVSDVDISLPLGGALSGQIIDATTGLAAGQGMVGRIELWVASGPFAGQLARQAIADSQGQYLLAGLVPGAYKATFGTSTHLGLIDTAFGGQLCPRGSCDLDALPTVFVTAGLTLPGISASLPRGPVIRGRVLDAASGQPLPPPKPQAIIGLVAFYGVDGRYASFDTPDGDGFYESRTGFPAGTFFAATFTSRNSTPTGENYIDLAYSGIDCPRLNCNITVNGTPLIVAGSDLNGIDFNLRQGGWITGTVRDAADNSGLGNVALEVYDSAGRLVAQTISNAIGQYRLDALPGGNYTVRTRNALGFQDQIHAGGSCTPFCNPVSGTPIAVTEGSGSSAINFNLVRSVAVSGTVTLSGAPLGNVAVEVYGAIGNFLAETLSAADGSFAFTNLAPGEFYLRTRNAFGHADVLYDGGACVGSACQVRRGTPIVLPPGGSVSGLSLTMAAGATISGEVFNRLAPASKLSGVRVQLLDDRGAVAFERTSNALGQFSFPALAAGDYHLVSRETPGFVDQSFGGTPCPSACNGLNGTTITIAAGASLTGRDLDLAPGASISGNVSTGGSPVVGAQVQVYNAAGVPVSQVPTNPSGNYEVNELPDGNFFVRAGGVAGFVSQLWNGIACSGYCDILSGNPATIVGSTPVGSVNFALLAGGAITGTVTASGGGVLPGIQVLAFDNAGFIAGAAISNGAGQYSIGGLINGSYRLRTTNTAGFVDRVFGGASCSPAPCALSGGSAVTVSGATVGGINFSLSPGSSISGSATDSFGNPLPDGTAVLYDSNGIELLTSPINNGLWSFSGLANGSYYLLIQNNLGLVDELYDGISCPAGACDIVGLGTPIVLGGGSLELGIRLSQSFDIALERGQSIRGRVTDAVSGDNLVGVTVFFFDANGQLAGQGTTDGRGEYESAAGLPAGSYFAATASGLLRGAGSNYVNQLYAGAACPLACDFSLGTPISLGSSGADNIDFALSQGAGVRGRIRGPGDANLVQVELRLFDASGRLAGTARSNSQGQFLIDGLPAGSYYAHTVNNLGLADVVFGNTACSGACNPLSGLPISVPASGIIEDIDFDLPVRDEVFADRFQ